jgi:hypothetical protein
MKILCLDLSLPQTSLMWEPLTLGSPNKNALTLSSLIIHYGSIKYAHLIYKTYKL